MSICRRDEKFIYLLVYLCSFIVQYLDDDETPVRMARDVRNTWQMKRAIQSRPDLQNSFYKKRISRKTELFDNRSSFTNLKNWRGQYSAI